LLIDGVDYPGVQVTAPTFNQNTGFDVGNFDINPFDNISYDEYGRPTYDYGILDAAYSSSYLDLYLGTRAADINVDGGAYIDTFSSHAPEELVPGSEFDTLDLRVYTAPGPDAVAFRIFQDMRGVQATYSITPATTTAATQAVSATDDVIHVADANALTSTESSVSTIFTGDGVTTKFSLVYNNVVSVDAVYLDGVLQNSNTYTVNIVQQSIVFNTAPASKVNINLSMTIFNSWGVLTINAERIMYRYWDSSTNTVSGLLRGTGGTAAAAHASGATVYNLGRNNLLPAEYQDSVVSSSSLANGSETVFTAEDISLAITGATTWNSANAYAMGDVVVSSGNYYRAIIDVPSGTAITNTTYWQTLSTAVQVYVGGILQTSGYAVTGENPVVVTFSTAPVNGVEVTIAVRRGVTWYEPGAGTASNGVPLNQTNTNAARFLRGL